jgi:hypothetical protein
VEDATMPVHDWGRVRAGIFHDFHHAWIEEIKRALNAGILPPEYYALAEHHVAGFRADVLTLRAAETESNDRHNEQPPRPSTRAGTAVLESPPQVQITAETDLEFYRRHQKAIVVRHEDGDHVVAVIEIVSPANKASKFAVESFVEKVCELLEQGLHLLIIDLHTPTERDPSGMHGLIWEAISGQRYDPPAGKPLTLSAYEATAGVKAYIEPVAVGDELKDMPLFLLPHRYVLVPLERTYRTAFDALPRRWREVLARRAET